MSLSFYSLLRLQRYETFWNYRAIAPSFLIYIKKNDEGLARRPKGKSTKQAQSDVYISFALQGGGRPKAKMHRFLHLRPPLH